MSVSGRDFNSSKLSCISSLPARMRMIDSKIKELECSQDFSHYKSMGIFPDAQGQLTPHSLVQTGRISNSSEMLWMFLLPWKPEFQSYLVQNLMQSIPHPNDASDKIWLRLAHWLLRYSSLKMFTHGRTH